MRIEGYLPIGTIVRLKQYEHAKEENDIVHMIIGYDGADSKKNITGEYVLVTYPFGLVHEELWYCQKEDIEKVIYIGFDRKK